MINPISSIHDSPATQPAGDQAMKNLGKEAFLKLLITQLNYQDPMSPLENESFVAQLAQFSSLEQMQNINQNLEDSINADFLLNKAMNNSLVTTLIGKDVLASTNTVSLKAGSEVDLGFTLNSPAKDVKLKIYDDAGTLVRTLDAGGRDKGDHLIHWDGKDSQGKVLPEGKYKFEIEAQSTQEGKTVEATPFVQGTITGVRYDQGVAYLLIGDIELSLGDVQRIMQGHAR